MSYIYGRINLDGKAVFEDTFNLMTSQLNAYQLPEKNKRIERNFAIGYASTQKVILNPYFDKNTGLYIVYEGILDNRMALTEKVKAFNNNLNFDDISDLVLILLLYIKFQNKFIEFLIGDFSFVIYDSKLKKIFAGRDPAGKRTLYYSFDGIAFTFSTTINPIAAVLSAESLPIINEKYLAEFIAMPDIRHEMTPGITIFETIKYLLPGAYLTIQDNKLIEKKYWFPEKLRIKRLFSRKKMIQEFRSIFDEAIACRVKTNVEIGILLSGGLDSSAIAYTAAPIVDHDGKIFRTYTSIPGSNYSNWVHPSRIADETNSVLLLKEQFPNLENHFETIEQYNALNLMNQLLIGYEQPYKFVDNSYWLYGLFEKASENGCTLLLNGTFGNANLSFGSIESHLHERLKRGNFIGAAIDTNDYCKVHHVSRKKFIKDIIKINKDGRKLDKNQTLCSPLIKKTMLEKYNIRKKILTLGYDHKTQLNFKKHQKKFHDPTILHHMGAAEVKFGLMHGIIDRDPTRDKRVLEYLLKLPYQFYFYKGHDRGVVRSAFENVIPEAIRTNYLTRGMQGADWLDRIKSDWPRIIVELKEMMRINEGIINLYDLNILEQLIEENREIRFTFEGSKAIRDLLIAYLIGVFYDMHTKKQ